MICFFMPLFQDHVETIEFSHAQGGSTFICTANVTFALKRATGASKLQILLKSQSSASNYFYLILALFKRIALDCIEYSSQCVKGGSAGLSLPDDFSRISWVKIYVSTI